MEKMAGRVNPLRAEITVESLEKFFKLANKAHALGQPKAGALVTASAPLCCQLFATLVK